MLSYRANLYAYKKMFVNAEADFKEVVSIRKKIGDPLYVSEDYIALAQFYLSTKEYKKCIEEVNEGLEVCKQGHILATELSLLGIEAEVYKANKVYDKYSATLEKIIVLSDSNNRMNSADKIADIQTKYEVQKKETLIAKQKLDLLQRNLLLYGAGVLAIVLAILFVYRFKKYQRKQKIIAEQKRKQNEVAIKDAEEKERKRIAAELHDNLGVQANAILHNSTLLNNSTTEDKNILADLQDTAKEMLLNLRETLWAMKTSDVSATDLWLRIINFMKQMGRHYTSVNFRVEGEVPKDFVISSSKALNIVLVLQESVNNAVKHAHANTISAASLKNDDSWVITIKDDGKGFDINTVKGKTDNYGLQNMQERAISGRFTYNIDSATGKGTKTIISITG
jgi:signal transduction histidine kinase